MESLLLILLVGLALAAVRTRDLLGATGILGAFSLVVALLWCTMGALDVGFTETAVGAGISTVLMLAAINRIGRREAGGGSGAVLKPALASMRERRERIRDRDARRAVATKLGAMAVCALVAAALLYGARDFPRVGDPASPANRNPEVVGRYLRDAKHPDASPNVVTAVLGDYRGYDTMGETTVIFTAALCVLLLLREARPRRGGRGTPDA